MVSLQQLLTIRREVVIADKYRIIRRIGGGSFGDIYLGINISHGEVSLWNYGSKEVKLYFVCLYQWYLLCIHSWIQYKYLKTRLYLKITCLLLCFIVKKLDGGHISRKILHYVVCIISMHLNWNSLNNWLNINVYHVDICQ